MKKKVILKPYQKKLIERKLKIAKEVRLIKNIVFDENTTAKDKLALIRTILK